MSKKLLTISLLVSGREETTKKCLDSLAGLLERLDSELILVDTGCGEALREELYGYTDQIIPFVFCNDFAKARNAGLERASGEWFLFLDDDEWFEDVGPIVEFFQSGEYREYDQAVYRARNYSNPEGTEYTDDWVSRMIKLEPDTRFEGRVHESLVPAVGKCKQIDAFVHHYGYAFADEEAKRKHFERNANILLGLIEEEPDNLRWRLQLAQEYYSIRDGKGLVKTGEDAIALIREIDRPFINECRGAFYCAVLLGEYLEGKYEDVERHCLEYMKDERNSAQGQCSLCSTGASGAEERKDRAALARYCELYFRYLKEHQEKERSEQEQIIEESIVLVKDLVSEERQTQLRNLWAWACACIGEPESFSQEQRELLMKDVQQMIDGNGEFLFLPGGIWDIAEGGVFPLEDMLLALPMSQWIVMVMVLQAKNSRTEWENVQEHLSAIRTREDLRYDYLDMHNSNLLVAAADPDEDYEGMCRLLQYYCKSNMSFARRVYTPAAFEGGMEMLPESCRGAVWIEQMFECEEQDWNGKLACLKKSAKEWPQLGETIKLFAKRIGEEQERRDKAAEEANRELYAMAKQVKAQVKAFMDAGMNAEALTIVRQLRTMLPNDKETAALERELNMRFS